MLSYETIMQETVWVGKFYNGGRIVGTWNEIGHIDESEFRDLDIVCTEGQPEILREFYEGYFNQHKYYVIKDYYDNVYAKKSDSDSHVQRLNFTKCLDGWYQDLVAVFDDRVVSKEEVIGVVKRDYSSDPRIIVMTPEQYNNVFCGGENHD